MVSASLMQRGSSLVGTNVGSVQNGFSLVAWRSEANFGQKTSWSSYRRGVCLRDVCTPAIAKVSSRTIQSGNAVSPKERTHLSAESSSANDACKKSYTWADAKRPRICILGGGFGGLYTALRLDSLTWTSDKRPQVLLIDQLDRFVFKPLLYEILSKEVDKWEIAPTFLELLSDTSVEFLQDSVKAVSPLDGLSGSRSIAPESTVNGGSVFLESGVQVDYDWLVMALGSESKRNLIPGALEFAIPFVTLDNALEVDRQLVNLTRERFGLENSPIEVAIVGSGYSGIELAATLAERLGNLGKIHVVDPHTDICASAPVGNQQSALKVIAARGIQVEGGFYVSSITDSTTSEDNGSLSSAHSGKLVLNLVSASQRQSRINTDSRQLKADLVIWTVGTKATVPSGPDSDSYLPFPVNGRGQADTDETLRVTGHPRMFALGDSAGAKDSSGRLLPTTAQVAFQQADYTGWNLWAGINDQPLLPFRYQHLGEMMTLGTTNAAVSVGNIENLTLDGLLGHTARKLAYWYRLPVNSHKAKVAVSWLSKSAINSMAFFQDELLKVLNPK